MCVWGCRWGASAVIFASSPNSWDLNTSGNARRRSLFMRFINVANYENISSVYVARQVFNALDLCKVEEIGVGTFGIDMDTDMDAPYRRRG